MRNEPRVLCRNAIQRLQRAHALPDFQPPNMLSAAREVRAAEALARRRQKEDSSTWTKAWLAYSKIA
jgi:hypothetical protein